MTKQLFLATLVAITLMGCRLGNRQQADTNALPVSNTPVPEWSHSAVIYEVNVRQFTPEGTFNAFALHLPRLKELGVDILWFMPIHPIGEKNRKGSLGSYYSIKDYKAANPEFGTLEEFKAVVNKAHELGMHVILDWVANHTAWDHPWVEMHPEWYTRDSLGNMYSPYDWTDVVQLNYDNHEMRAAMIDAMAFWVREANVDGFRADVAGMVPLDFWEKTRTTLDAIRPVYMLAENETELDLMLNAFNSNYSWRLHHTMNAVARGEENATHVAAYFRELQATYPEGSYPMQFITNHDENSWAGTEFDRLGDAVNTFAALTFVVEGIPLIYTGQEVGMDNMLEFFERDEVIWDDPNGFTPFYQSLTSLKENNPALWNGRAGGRMQIIETNNPESVFLFTRTKSDNTVVALFNLSANAVTVTAETGLNGSFVEYFTSKQVEMPFNGLELQPWEFKVFEVNK